MRRGVRRGAGRFPAFFDRPFDQGDEKCQRFPASGFGLGQQITALHRQWNGGLLNGSRRGKPGLLQTFREERCERQFGKRHHKTSLLNLYLGKTGAANVDGPANQREDQHGKKNTGAILTAAPEIEYRKTSAA